MTELWKPTRTSRLWKRGDPVGLPRNGLIALWDPYRDAYGLSEEARLALQTGVDYSGRGNTLTYGASTNAGADDPTNTGTAWAFGGDDYMRVADSATLDVGQFSVLGVTKIAPAATASALYDKSSGTGTSVGYGAIFRTSNPYFSLYTYDTSLHRTGGTVASVRDDAWHAIGGTMKSGAQSVYVDGVQVATDTLSYDEAAIANNWPATIFAQDGGNAPTPNTYSTGDLAFLAIWNRALTPSECARTYRYVKGLMAKRGVTLA